MRIKHPIAAAPAVAAALIMAACSPGASARPKPGDSSPAPSVRHVIGHFGQAAGPATDWRSYHANAARTGFVPGLPAAGRLAIDWTRHLDGAVYGQPLVIGGLVVAATENDSVYGLSRVTGRVRWRTHLATPLPLSAQPCGDIDPIGITSTPVYYQGLVYVVAQAGRLRHVLFGLSMTGKVRYRHPVPSPDGRPYYDQQRAALAATAGRIYVSFGGHSGDCGPYEGSVVGVPAAGSALRTVSYRVPTSDHAGIWAPGGPAVGASGNLFVSVGNGDISGRFDDSDSVTRLSPGLRRLGVFAPATWRADNAGDLDLGSLTPALTSAGQILIVGKRGTGYLLSPTRLGGVGGQIAQLPVCNAFGAAAVHGSLVIVPCAGGGPAAVRVPPGHLHVVWRGPSGAEGSPVIGGGAVWVTDYNAGVLYELRQATGRVLHQIALGVALPHFESPSLSGRLVLIGTLHGVEAVSGA